MIERNLFYTFTGDSGYAAEMYMVVPILNAAAGSPEERYNRHHARARGVIERCNGLLKARWRCLLRHRTLHYMPPRASKITYACIILHNMCLHHRVHLEREEDEEDVIDEVIDEVIDDPNVEVLGVRGRHLTVGQRQQAMIVRRYFNR